MKLSARSFASAMVGAMIMAPGVSMALPTDTQVLNVTVVDTIDVIQDTAMSFDQIAVNGAEQTIPSSVDAVYTVDGADNGAYSISTLGTSANLTDGSNTMPFTATSSKATGTLSATGSDTFDVAGELTVGATQAGGTYTGNLVVTVEYAAAPAGNEGPLDFLEDLPDPSDLP